MRWLTDKYIIIMLLVFPLWTGLSGYSSITLGKFAFFAACTGLWLLSLAVCFLMRPRLPARPSAAAVCALAFMAAACLSACFSPFGSVVLIGASRWDGLLTLLMYGGIFLGVSAFGTPKLLYVRLLAVSASLCCLVAVLQLCRINVLGLFPDGLDYYDSGLRYSGEYLGTIGNVDVLAAFLCLCAPLFTGVALTSNDKHDRLLLLPAALCLGVLAVSRTASGAVACAGCLLLGFPYYVNLIRWKLSLTLLCAGLSCVLVLAALCGLYSFPPESGTLWELSQVLHGRVEDSFGSSRVGIWRESLSLISQRPLLGGGPDTLTLRSSIDFSRFVPETGVTLCTHVDNAHNEYLNYAVNIGLLGLLAYLGLCVLSLRRALTERRDRVLVPALGIGLLCYLIQSFFGLGLCLVAPFVWIFMGLLNSPVTEVSNGTNPKAT